LLTDFLDKHHSILHDKQLDNLEKFLECTDMDIYDWVCGKSQSNEKGIQEIVNLIRAKQS